METLTDVTTAAAATNAAPASGNDAAALKAAPLTLLHTQDGDTKWHNADTGESAGVRKPNLAGVKALYAQPTEPFSVATSPTHLYPVVNTNSGDGQPAGSFDIGTGSLKTTGNQSLVDLAMDAFANPAAVYRIVEINPELAAYPVGAKLPVNTLVRLYFER
jgi:hypothetical protein